MALICLRVPIVFTISSFEFHQVKLPWLHRQGWVASNSPDLSPLDCQVWGAILESYHRQQPKLKQFPGLKINLNRFGLPYQRKAVTTLWKTTASDCRHVGQPAVDILNI